MDGLADAQLLQAWRAGDRTAAEALMRRHYRCVLRFFELNASWVAEDLTQRTFLAAIERADFVRDGAAFRPYLLGIARRQLAMHLRRLSASDTMHSFEAAVAPGRTQLSTLLARNQEQLLVLRALAGMPRAAQVLLLLHYWEGLGAPELAAATAAPASTIRNQLARARQRLRTRMEELGSPRRAAPAVADAELDALLASVLRTDAPAPTVAVREL